MRSPISLIICRSASLAASSRSSLNAIVMWWVGVSARGRSKCKSLRTVNRKVPLSAVSSAVTQTSPSPCTPCPSPHEKLAPGTNTGRYRVVPPVYGLCTSIVPREFGGNMDLKELTAGTTLYLPVFVPGANFSCGDGHGVQGDGEVCVTALETALSGTFRFTVRKDLHFDLPRAETPTHHITMAFNDDLDDAAKDALRQMIKLIGERMGLAASDAYMFSSLAVDMRVTQLVDGNKGIHAMLPKRYAGRVAG